jgi:succinate dehydrogenase hydrophobic anchor subunit
MKKEFMKWGILLAVSVCGTATLLCISLSSTLIMGGDAYGLARYILIRLTALFLATPALVGLMLAVDFVTPGDWMEAIGHDPKACSYIMAAVVLVIGAVLCWT